MSIIIGGKRIDTSKWFESCCWLDDPKRAPRISDFDARVRWCRSIVTHTTKGKRGSLRQGVKPSTRAESLASYQVKTERFVSWDWTIDTDQTVIWQNDPLEYYSWHATSWNPISMGGELVQDDDGSLYEGQLTTYVDLMDLLTLAILIQRQIPYSDGSLISGVMPRADEKGKLKGANLTGIFAHFHNTKNRGQGDPGPHPFKQLEKAGYEQMDFNTNQDLIIWKERQRGLGMSRSEIDGIPGPATAKILEKRRLGGMWVSRPKDEEMLGVLRG